MEEEMTLAERIVTQSAYQTICITEIGETRVSYEQKLPRWSNDGGKCPNTD